jgi:hypothetical protein
MRRWLLVVGLAALAGVILSIVGIRSPHSSGTVISGRDSTAASTPKPPTPVNPPNNFDPSSLLIQRDKTRFPISEDMLRLGLPSMVKDIQDIRWISLRGGASIDPKQSVEKNADEVEAIVESNKPTSDMTLYFVRLNNPPWLTQTEFCVGPPDFPAFPGSAESSYVVR